MAATVNLLDFEKLINRIILLVCLALLGACSNVGKNPEDWPAELPPRDYFVTYYEGDPAHAQEVSLDNYLLWVARYYQGWVLYDRGWLDTTEEVLASVADVAERETVRLQLEEVGRLVSAEWAKNNKYRLIDTRMLLVWGNALQDSMASGTQTALLDAALADIKAVLAGDLASSEVTDSRYAGGADPNEDDPFGF
jgi:hypothetical protein